MLSATNLLAKLSEYEEDATDIRTQAKAQGDWRTALAAIHTGIATIDAFERIRSNAATIVDADPVAVQPPAFEPSTLRLALRTLIEAGVATMPSPTTPHQEEEPASGQATDAPNSAAS